MAKEPDKKAGGTPESKPTPIMAVIGLLCVLGGIGWLVYGIVTAPPPKKGPPGKAKK